MPEAAFFVHGRNSVPLLETSPRISQDFEPGIKTCIRAAIHEAGQGCTAAFSETASTSAGRGGQDVPPRIENIATPA